MKKPKMKQEVAIRTEAGNVLYVYSTPDAANELREFGSLEQWNIPDLYRLEIDSRFDVSEVITYIKENWGEK
jgi:hypothetical protein